MTEQISTLIPSLCLVGDYIQENVLKGYRLVEGYPLNFGWQYEVVMTMNKDIPTIPQPTPERAAGRPKGSTNKQA